MAHVILVLAPVLRIGFGFLQTLTSESGLEDCWDGGSGLELGLENKICPPVLGLY